ncbi:MAG: DEAD/DEAH box helicase [Candidatus Pacearchaeota archaeon]|nr:DEAD/DEAH box helicase [Candidatus Pacearchaeota archaeon]
MEKFKKLGIDEAVLKVVDEFGFQEPSEIQEKAIPLVLQGKDVIAGSATGSGKTLVFGAGIVRYCSKIGKIQSLVLTPTRELAEQVANELKKFSKYKHMSIVSIYGGVAIEPQMEKLRNADVVVGTPGRILDHLKRRTLNLTQVKVLVLDEADRMLDMGFIYDVESIIRYCPKTRQTLLFSATISADIANLASRYMINPIEILAQAYVEESKLHQVYYDVSSKEKFSALVYLLKKEEPGLVMVFCNTRRTVDFVANNLEKAGIEASATHGGHSQSKRTSTLEEFHSSKVYVLVCTDVAARGLDIKNVSHVYNYDIPKTSKEYIHRVGRTARAGKEGKAISIVSDKDYENFREVLKDTSLEINEEKFTEQLPILYIRPFDRHRSGARYGKSFGRGSRSFGNRSRGRSYGGDRRSDSGSDSGSGYARRRRDSGDSSESRSGSRSRFTSGRSSKRSWR